MKIQLGDGRSIQFLNDIQIIIKILFVMEIYLFISWADYFCLFRFTKPFLTMEKTFLLGRVFHWYGILIHLQNTNLRSQKQIGSSPLNDWPQKIQNIVNISKMIFLIVTHVSRIE